MGITNRFASEAFVIDKLNNLGGAGNGSSAQGDWSQNDPTANDYIKNRTHYSETIFTEIVPETRVDLSTLIINSDANLIEGQTYSVNYNGENYECAAASFEIEGGISFIAIGNIDGVSDEPFVIGYISKEYEEALGMSGLVIEPLDDPSEIILSIAGNTEHIQKLDNKFLDLDWKAVNSNIEIELFPETIVKNKDRISNFYMSIDGMKNGDIIFYIDNERIEIDFDYYESIYQLFIGNKHLIDSNLPDTGEFYAILMEGTPTIYFNDDNNHTLSIKTYYRKTLPEKYLPESICSLKFRNTDMDGSTTLSFPHNNAFVIQSSRSTKYTFPFLYEQDCEVSPKTVLPLERKEGQILSCILTTRNGIMPVWIDPPASSTIQMITWEAND